MRPVIRSFSFVCALVALLTFGGNGFGLVVRSGADLEVRLETAVGSRISHPGDRVEARVISPMLVNEAGLNPEGVFLQGATISGTVREVRALGLGIRKGSAELNLRFTRLRLRDGSEVPIAAGVEQVEMAREHVDSGGTIVGIDPAANVSSAVSFLMSTVLLHTGLEVPAITVKVLAARSPDSEIYYPAGTDLFLRLERDVALTGAQMPPVPIRQISGAELSRVARMLQELPGQQAERAPHEISDLMNVLLLGSEGEVSAAFRVAGWAGENRHSPLALYRLFHSTVQRMGYAMAPMSKLTFNGMHASRSYQKSLNTLSKRHHVRFWRNGDSDMWLGAASEDVAIAMRQGHLTHAVDADIDGERAKVVNDLWLSGCVAEASLVPRQELRVEVGPGSAITTDGSLAVLRLGDCGQRGGAAPRRLSLGGRIRQIARALEGDVLRANPLTVGIAASRSICTLVRWRLRSPWGFEEQQPERLSVLEGSSSAKLACVRGVCSSRPVNDGRAGL